MAVLVGIALFYRDGSVVVGRDGVYLTRRHRFISFEEVQDVCLSTENRSAAEYGQRSWVFGVALYLHNEERYLLTTSQEFGAQARAQRLRDHISEAHAAFHQVEDSQLGGLDATSPGQRDPVGWLSYLRGLGTGMASHRQAAMSLDTLWQIVESPAAATKVRARAVAALGSDLDQSERQRLRVALSESAAPELRDALKSVLSRDDRALAEALYALEDERERELRRNSEERRIGGDT